MSGAGRQRLLKKGGAHIAAAPQYQSTQQSMAMVGMGRYYDTTHRSVLGKKTHSPTGTRVSGIGKISKYSCMHPLHARWGEIYVNHCGNSMGKMTVASINSGSGTLLLSDLIFGLLINLTLTISDPQTSGTPHSELDLSRRPRIV